MTALTAAGARDADAVPGAGVRLDAALPLLRRSRRRAGRAVRDGRGQVPRPVSRRWRRPRRRRRFPIPASPETFARCKLDRRGARRPEVGRAAPRSAGAAPRRSGLRAAARRSHARRGAGRAGAGAAIPAATTSRAPTIACCWSTWGRDLRLSPIPEPLLAPPRAGGAGRRAGRARRSRYGGAGRAGADHRRRMDACPASRRWCWRRRRSHERACSHGSPRSRRSAGRRPRPDLLARAATPPRACVARMDGHQRPRRLRVGDAGRRADPPLARAAGRGAARAARPDVDAEPSGRDAALRRRHASAGGLTDGHAADRRGAPRCNGRPRWRLRARRGRVEKSIVMPYRQNTTYLSYRLAPGAPAGGADAGAGLRRAAARGTGRRAAAATIRSRSTPGGLEIAALGDRYPAARLAAARCRRRRSTAVRRPRVARGDVRHRARARLRLARAPARAGRVRGSRCSPGEAATFVVSTESWERIDALSAGEAARAGRRAPAAADRRGGPTACAAASAPSWCWRPISSSSRPRTRPRDETRLARRGRQRAHHHRRLPLVHRLGARHDDQPRRADAGHRAATGGARHPADLRASHPRRSDPEPVSRGRERGPLSHRRRDALVLSRARSLRARTPATPRRAGILLPRLVRRRSPSTSPGPASGSASIPRTACCARAPTATS